MPKPLEERGRSGGQQVDRLSMAWSEEAEVPAVEGGQLRLAEPFDDREHGD